MKETKKLNYLSILMCIYCVFTVVQNLFEMKTIGTETLAIMGGGTVVSWIPFMVGDITSEVYGKNISVRSFTLAGVINLLVVILAQFVIFLPGSYLEQNVAFEQIFSNGVRNALASFIAFWCGNYVNAHIMVKMRDKVIESGKDNGVLFFIRAVVSTIFGQLIDNAIFLLIAFAPIGLSAFEMPMSDIFGVVITGTLIETAIESLLVPFITRPVTNKIKSIIE